MAKAKTSMVRLGGRLLARYIRYVSNTSEVVFDPPDFMDRLHALHPLIFAMWHGQFMMLPLVNPRSVKVKAMVARHGDAELIGEALRHFDIDLIRGAGAGERKRDRGGAAALRQSIRAFSDDATVAMTADVPPGPARTAGIGIITLARLTGRPIVPIACATKRFTSFDTWSQLTINLPHSKLVFASGDPVRVPRDADEATLEAARRAVEDGLNATTRRAYELAGGDITRATPLELLPPGAESEPGLAVKVYRTALSLARPAAPLLLDIRARQGKEEPARRGERLGIAGKPRPAGALIWVHAASVGETNAALPLIEEILKADPARNVLLTTGTKTSAALAAARLPDRAVHQYIPLDVHAYARRFLDYWQPNLAIFTESEIWPNLILETGKRGIPLALINARMSPRSMKRWRRHARRARPVFSRFQLALAQSDKIARTLKALGVRRVDTVGNLKIDSPPPPVNRVQLASLEEALKGRHRFVAASTHPGEERVIAEAHTLIARQFPDFLTIIVPRHPERGAELQGELQKLGFSVDRRSTVAIPNDKTQIFIADTIGELGTYYSLAPVAFVGGSLVERGGQNPIEAVRLGAVVLTGPSHHNFADAYGVLLDSLGAVEVRSGDDIAAAVKRFLTDDLEAQRMRLGAKAALLSLSGALAKTLDALKPLLDASGSRNRATS